MRRTSLVASILGGMPLGLFAVHPAGPASVQDSGQPPGEQSFVGSWWVTVFETDGPPTRALFTFGADGAMVTAEHPVVTPPGAPGVIFASSGHGAWEATGPETAIFTFAGLGSDGQGNLFATVTYRGSITLAANGQTLSGDFVATIADPAGNTLATFPMTLQGTRIVAEAPEMPTTDTLAAAQ